MSVAGRRLVVEHMDVVPAHLDQPVGGQGGPDAVVFVNGVQLGAEPSPLLHGDKVEVGGQQLRYGDDAQGGSTQCISAASLAETVKAASSAPKKPTGATGGRLVSLVDGREYQVPDEGVTFGREVGNDIVIASDEYASGRHARFEPRRDGVYVEDIGSTNGTFVNGAQITRAHRLVPGDVVRTGETDLRFEA